MEIAHLCLSFIMLSMILGLVACASDGEQAAIADPTVATRSTVSAPKPLTKPGEWPLFLANVTFEPGCRNDWHIHHAKSGGGQMLICTAGEGWYQEEGKKPVPAHPRSGLRCRLRGRANIHIIANCGTANTDRDRCDANESTANCYTYHCATDIHRGTCHTNKPTTNPSASDGGNGWGYCE